MLSTSFIWALVNFELISYRHIFAVEQPDLNWENPKVRAAVHDIIRFWLERGAKGFRMGELNHLILQVIQVDMYRCYQHDLKRSKVSRCPYQRL